MAKNTLVRAKMLKVNPQFHADIDAHLASHPLQFFTKNNLRIQKATLALSLCVQIINLSSFLFMVPCNQQGNQVRICNKSFGDFIGTILANKGEINYHVAV